MLFWWWPYFLGDAAGTAQMVESHRRELEGLPRLLPAFRGADQLVPDIEHTLLLPLSMLTLALAVRDFVQQGHATAAPVVFGLASASVCALPSLFIFRRDVVEPFAELGPILTSASVAVTCIVVKNLSKEAAAVREAQTPESASGRAGTGRRAKRD